MRHNHRDFGHNHEHERAYNEYINTPPQHKAKLSHELIAAAVSYEAAKAYNKHCAENGAPVSHEKAKEIFAALSGGILDRFIETKGLDFIDRQKAHREVNEYGGAHFGGY